MCGNAYCMEYCTTMHRVISGKPLILAAGILLHVYCIRNTSVPVVLVCQAVIIYRYIFLS